MAEVKPYTREERDAMREAEIKYPSGADSDRARWLATLAAVEAERDEAQHSRDFNHEAAKAALDQRDEMREWAAVNARKAEAAEQRVAALEQDCDLNRRRLESSESLRSGLATALAAREAEIAECRRALESLIKFAIGAASAGGNAVILRPGDALQSLLKEIEDSRTLLSTPSSRAALDAMLAQAATLAWSYGCGLAEDASAYANMSTAEVARYQAADVAAIVERVARGGADAR